jgi:hypothetical protein
MSRRKGAARHEEYAWWRDLPQPARLELRAFYRALKARMGVLDALTLEYARLAAEALWLAKQSSTAALVEGTKRKYGKGRRPNLPALDRRLKRAGLQVGTVDQLVRRLEELAGKRTRSLATALGHGTP